MKKYSLYILIGLVVIGIIVLACKLIGGAASLVSGAFNAVLGIIVIVALIVIVIWMFAYANRNR